MLLALSSHVFFSAFATCRLLGFVHKAFILSNFWSYLYLVSLLKQHRIGPKCCSYISIISQIDNPFTCTEISKPFCLHGIDNAEFLRPLTEFLYYLLSAGGLDIRFSPVVAVTVLVIMPSVGAV